MKKLAYSILIIPFLISCGGDEEESSETTNNDTADTSAVVEEPEIVNSFLIEENVVGIFEIGKAVPENLPDELKIRQFVDNEDVEGESIEHTHNVIFNQLEDVVELIMDQGSGEHHEDKLIEEMWVLSNYYETGNGMSVGTTVAEFQEKYPDAKGWYAPDLGMYLLETEEIVGTQFIIDEADMDKTVKAGSNMVEVPIGNFKTDGKIKKIRLY